VTAPKSVQIAAGVSAHFLDDELLLFSTANQCIYRLNPTAAYIWCLLEEGTDPAAIPGRIGEVFGIDPLVAASDTEALIAEWLSAVLVSTPAEKGTPVDFAEESVPPDFSEPFSGLVSDEEFGCELRFTLAGKTFRLRLPSALEESSVCPIFSHIETPGVGFDAWLDVISRDGEYVILGERGRVATVRLPVEIGPIVSQEALRIAYRSNDYLISVHSGAVGNGEGCVVLPGPSAAGKSTLTAALVAAGFLYFTDEVAVVERGTHQLIPCPVSLRIKLGSWDLVRDLWGEKLTVCHTVGAEGLVIKYVVPPEGSFARDKSQSGPVLALVFPKYDPSCPTRMVPLPRSEAVQMLQTAGYDVDGHLTSEKVSELISWIGGIPCYTMTFQSLDEAVELVRGVFK
jgi:hypothetical protein